MATKEDILEQIVEEYLIHKGYFVRHNLKFLPRQDHAQFIKNKHSNHSDIDVIGIHPRLTGIDKVIVVSCKSWQDGFNPASEIRMIAEKKKARGREAWKSFRELVEPIWSEAFMKAVHEATGTDRFVYMTAVSKLSGDRLVWENHQPFQDAIGGNPVKIITFREMALDINKNLTKTLASTEVGRLLQMFKAAGIEIASGK
ncbi:MAG: hypothetical protein KBC46_05250 [Ferrovibrio sp.]|nr:hypothetical protein [Ferrovibrio sp.]